MSVSFTEEQPHHPLFMHDQQVENVAHSLHLGITLQHNLKWDQHIDNTCIKAHKRLDILNSLSLKLSRHTLDILYKAYIRSILEYADILFGNATQDNLDKLNKVHKRGGKIVSGAIRGTSSEVIFNELAWETLDTRRDRRKLILYSDIVHNRAPPYLQPHIPQTVQERTQGRYQLRNNRNLSQPPARTETFKNSYFPSMVDVWNNTDPAIKSISTRTTLKTTLCRTTPKPSPFFSLGKRSINVVLARIRMECSELNSHLFANHVIAHPLCQCGQVETAAHYFLECPMYTLHRLRLVNQLRLLEIDFTIDILLHGTSYPASDRTLIEHIDQFITATDRFSLISGPPLP